MNEDDLLEEMKQLNEEFASMREALDTLEGYKAFNEFSAKREFIQEKLIFIEVERQRRRVEKELLADELIDQETDDNVIYPPWPKGSSLDFQKHKRVLRLNIEADNYIKMKTQDFYPDQGRHLFRKLEVEARILLSKSENSTVDTRLIDIMARVRSMDPMELAQRVIEKADYIDQLTALVLAQCSVIKDKIYGSTTEDELRSIKIEFSDV